MPETSFDPTSIYSNRSKCGCRVSIESDDEILHSVFIFVQHRGRPLFLFPTKRPSVLTFNSVYPYFYGYDGVAVSFQNPKKCAGFGTDF